VTAPGAVTGLAGGILAAASIALSGLLTWVAAEVAADAGPALARVVFDLGFAAGAAGFVVPSALLIAGVAVPSLILRLTPRPLAWAGLVICCRPPGTGCPPVPGSPCRRRRDGTGAR
jgi:hypothetical protein